MPPSFYSLDVVIPSYRFHDHAAFLARIVSLTAPPHWKIRFYVIGDNPSTPVPALLQDCIDKGLLHFHRNEQNRGINYSRNKGIDLSHSHWILILDDDIVPDTNLLPAYTEAIEASPQALGFAGVVEFPPVINSFTRALHAAGYTHYFSQAKNKKQLPWATGANLVLNREKLGAIRFDESFRTNEGGDEVELAVRLKEKYNTGFFAVPEAIVHHPWWKKGQPDFSRARNYSRGNLRLLQLHPVYTVYRFCNSTELLLLLVFFSPLLWLAGISLNSLLFYAASIVMVDVMIHFLRSRKESGRLPFPVLFYTWWLRKSEQAAYAGACIGAFYWTGFFKRFDFELRHRQKHFHTNRWFWMEIAGLLLAGILIQLF